MNERLNQIYVIRWWSRSAVMFMEDLTTNPTEYRNMLQAAGDAASIETHSVQDLLEAYLENDPRND